MINENKALTGKKNRFTPYCKFQSCRICKQKVHQAGSYYCQRKSGLEVRLDVLIDND